MHWLGLFRRTLALAASGFLLPALMAQADLVSAGGDGASGGNSISFSLGQAFAAVTDAADGSVYQGVQQPYELFVVSLDREPGPELALRLFPNPTAGWLVLEYPEHLPVEQGWRYELRDIRGRSLDARDLAGPRTEILMMHQPPGAYVLSVFRQQERLQSFQVIKQ